MAGEHNPSGLPDAEVPPPKNRLSRALDRRPTTATATAGFAMYMFGIALLMASVFVMIAGLTMAVGSMGTGWTAHVIGVVLLVGGGAGFAAGRWFLEQYRVQRRP